MKNLPFFTTLLRKTGQCVTGCIIKHSIRRVIYKDAGYKEIVIETTENLHDLLHAIEFREKNGSHWWTSVKKKGLHSNPPNNWLEKWLMQDPKYRSFTLTSVDGSSIWCNLIQKRGGKELVVFSSIESDVTEAVENTQLAIRTNMFKEAAQVRDILVALFAEKEWWNGVAIKKHEPLGFAIEIRVIHGLTSAAKADLALHPQNTPITLLETEVAQVFASKT